MAQAKTLTSNELRRVLDYIATRKHAQRNRAMLLLTHWAGMRIGEVAALTWANILDNLGNVKEEIRLESTQTKGSTGRTVFLCQKLRKELNEYIEQTKQQPSDFALFYTQKQEKRGFTANTLAQHFMHMYRNAGISGASSHSGRRSFASNLGAKGVSVRVLMQALGHKDISTTIRYVDASDDMIRKAVELV